MIHLLLFPFLFLIQAQNTTTYYVSSVDGTDTPTCGNQTHPCLSINHTLGLYLNGVNPIVIKLAAGVFSGPNNTQISFGGSPSPPLTISAEGSVIVDFQNLTTGWTITSYPSDLNLLGITFTRMLEKGVSFSGSSSQPIKYLISGCSFDNNFFTTYSIQSVGLDVTIGENIEMIIDQCYFSNNYESSMDSLNWSYGPLVLHSGIIQVQNSFFLNNTMRQGPLTILNSADGLPPLEVVVTNCTFRKNLGLEAASIYSSKIRNTKKIQLSDLLVEENEGFLSIMALSDGPQSLSNSRIINNKLTYDSSGALTVKSQNSPGSEIFILSCNISQNSAPQSDNGAKLYGIGLQCNGIKMDTTGTVIANNKMGNFSNASVQISCVDCPGCPFPPENESNQLLWLLLLLLIIPVVAIIGFLFYKRRQDYKAI